MARGLATTPEEDGTHQESPSTFKPRLNLRYIRDNIDKVAENARLRKVLDVDLDAYVKAFDQRHTLDTTIKELRSQRNHIAREVTRLVREGNTAATEELSAQGRKIKEEIQQAEDEKLRLEHIVTEIADRIPNDTHPDVPIGPEENARQLRVVGECRVTTDPATPLLDHIALGQHLDLFDLESAASVTGTSFYYLRRAAALLELALIQWSMNRCVARGFTPISTPDIVRMAVANACGFRPRDQEASQTYLVAPNATHRKTHSPSLCLSATAEIPLAGMLAGKAIEKTHRLVAFGRCFRAEAGGRGRENRGLYRVHQFSKVEMFVACGPTESDAMLEEIRDIQESLLSELELTYR
jgi:seryl-tRNA synthetase